MEAPAEKVGPAAQPTLRQAVIDGGRFLGAAGIENSRLDAELLLRHALGVAQAEFYLRLAEPMPAQAEFQFRQLLGRRARREPLAYITGRKEFWSTDFVVTPEVLIPRPETELLVELALKRTGGMVNAPLKIVDIGTGSGAIAVCLAKELPQARITAVDISRAALQVARRNAERHGVADRIRFAQGDFLAPVAEEAESFDLMIANPPYIRTEDLAQLAPEIRLWEPAAALDGGADGLDSYRRLARQCHRCLASGGDLLLEIGDGMAKAVGEILARAGCYESAALFRDYAGRDRVLATRKRVVPEAAAKG